MERTPLVTRASRGAGTLLLALSITSISCGNSESGSPRDDAGIANDEAGNPDGGARADGGDGEAGATSACATEPLRPNDVHYYCDCAAGADAACAAGDDAKDGLTPATAKRTWASAAAQFASMQAGHTVALCRGGSFRDVQTQGTIRNLACKADSTCDLRDYGDAQKPRPVLEGNGKPLFEIGWYQNYAQKPVAGLRFLNLDIRKVDTLWTMLGSVTDVEICGVAATDAPGAAQYVVTTSTTKRIAMHHNTFTRVGTKGQGYLGACDDCSIDSNVWDFSGGPTNRDHPIYIGANPEPCTSGCAEPISDGGSLFYHRTQRMRIAGNRLTHSSPSNGVCVGTVIVVHEPHDDLLVENNFIYEAPGDNGGCYGISISNGGDAPGQWRRAVIRRNQVFNGGNSPLSIENCQDCVIDSNLIVNSKEAFGITVPWHPQSSGMGPNLMNTRTKVRNNTIYVTGDATNPGGTGILVGTEGTGYEITNNAIYYAPTTKPNGWRCFDFGLSAGAYASTVGNACKSGAPDDGAFKSYVAGDPQFVSATGDPLTADFTLRDGSPLVDTGDAPHAAPTAIGAAKWSASDKGKARGAKPDIGAYER